MSDTDRQIRRQTGVTALLIALLVVQVGVLILLWQMVPPQVQADCWHQLPSLAEAWPYLADLVVGFWLLVCLFRE